MFEEKLAALGDHGIHLIDFVDKRKGLFGCPKGHSFEEQPSRLLFKIRSGQEPCTECRALLLVKERARAYKEKLKSFGFQCKGYVDVTTPIKHRCPAGHVFMREPVRICQGMQCPECLTPHQEDRIKRFTKLYKGIGWVVSDISRKPNSSSLPCKIHCIHCSESRSMNLGEKTLWPCSCTKEATPKEKPTTTPIPKKASTQEKTRVFKQNLKLVHPHIKLCSKYKNSVTPVVLKCRSGHKWETLPNNVMASVVGCPTCGRKLATQKKRKSNAQYCAEVLNAYKGNVIPIETYISDDTPILHSCSCGKLKYKIRPNSVIFGGFKKCFSCSTKASYGGFSNMACVWLDLISETFGIQIQHAKNSKEFSVKHEGKIYKVDGYCESTNTIYEFLGDDWHGSPYKSFESGVSHHPYKTKSDAKLLFETMRRFHTLSRLGFRVYWVWQSDYSSGRLFSGIMHPH